jgi:hypothetical protein
MLPFVRHNTLKVPHSLAAIAAAVCLGLAFTSDIQNRLTTLQPDTSAESPVDIAVKMPEFPSKDGPTEAESARSSGSEQTSGALSGFLLPWLPRLRPAG